MNLINTFDPRSGSTDRAETAIKRCEVNCAWIAAPGEPDASLEGRYLVTLEDPLPVESVGLAALALFRKVVALPGPDQYQIDVIDPDRRVRFDRAVPLDDDYPIPTGTVTKMADYPHIWVGVAWYQGYEATEAPDAPEE